MFFYEPLSATAIVSVLLYLVFLIGMNELSRLNKWVGAVIFIALPLVLTVFVWPHTAVEGTGAGTWFQWVKTYSCLAGAILGWLIVYFPLFQKKYIVCIPPIIFAINILEACIRDFQLTGVNGIVDGYMVVGGPWNVMNGIAGILNAICICGFFGIIVSRGKKKDYVWPDQLWFWIIGYDLWNFAYTYNCMSDHSTYTGLALLIACTVPTFFTKRGAWLQHRAQTLALYAMFAMALPQFYTFAEIPTTHNPTAFFVVSLIALASNVALAAYQFHRIRARKLNPLKDELYNDTKSYQEVVEENR